MSFGHRLWIIVALSLGPAVSNSFARFAYAPSHTMRLVPLVSLVVIVFLALGRRAHSAHLATDR